MLNVAEGKRTLLIVHRAEIKTILIQEMKKNNISIDISGVEIVSVYELIQNNRLKDHSNTYIVVDCDKATPGIEALIKLFDDLRRRAKEIYFT